MPWTNMTLWQDAAEILSLDSLALPFLVRPLLWPSDEPWTQLGCAVGPMLPWAKVISCPQKRYMIWGNYIHTVYTSQPKFIELGFIVFVNFETWFMLMILCFLLCCVSMCFPPSWQHLINYYQFSLMPLDQWNRWKVTRIECKVWGSKFPNTMAPRWIPAWGASKSAAAQGLVGALPWPLPTVLSSQWHGHIAHSSPSEIQWFLSELLFCHRPPMSLVLERRLETSKWTWIYAGRCRNN